MYKSKNLVGALYALYLVSAMFLFAMGVVVLLHYWAVPEHIGHAMPYTLFKGGAVLLLVIGATLIATLYQWRLAVWPGLLCLSGVVLISLGHSVLPWAVPESRSFPVSLSSSLSLVCIVAACAFARRKRGGRLVCLVAGSSLVALSVLSFVSFWLDLPDSFTQTRYEAGQLSISPIMALIGIAIARLPILLRGVHAVPRRPLAILALGAVLTSVCWHSVDMQLAKQDALRQEMSINSTIRTLEQWFNQQKQVIGRLASRWEVLPPTVESELWQLETQTYFRDISELTGLMILTQGSSASQLVARNDSAEIRLQQTLEDRGFQQWIERIQSGDQAAYLSSFDLVTESLDAVFIAVPIRSLQAIETSVVAMFDPRPGIQSLLADKPLQTAIRLDVDGKRYITSGSRWAQAPEVDPASLGVQPTSIRSSFGMDGLEIEVTSVTAPLSRAEWHTYLPGFVLLSGLLLVLLVLVHQYFGMRVSRHDVRLRKTLDRLTQALAEERRLRASNEKIQRFSKEIMCSIDAELRFTAINAACTDIFGYLPEEMIGRSILDFIIDDDRSKTLNYRSELVAGTGSEKFQNRYRCKDGSVAVMMWSVNWSEEDQNFFCVGMDVTLLEEAERLREERDAFFALSPEMFGILDLDFQIYQVNDAFCEALGYSAEELYRKDLLMLFSSQDVPEVLRLGALLAEGKEIQNQQIQVRTKGGVLLWLQFSAVQSRGVVYLAARNITKIHETQQQLAESQHLLKIAEDEADIGGWTLDMSSGEVTWSAAVCRIHEVPEGTKPTLDEALHFYLPSCRPDVEEVIEQAIEKGGTFEGEYRIRTAKGNVRWVKTVGSVLLDHIGKAIRLQGAFQDVTTARIASDKIKALADRLQTTLESITDAFFMVDQEWRFTFLNPQAEQLLQRPSSELLGESLWKEFPESVGSIFDERYHLAIEAQEATSFEAFYPPLNDYFEISAYPSEEGLAVYFRSIKERKAADQRLQETLLELERSNTELESFAYVSSHDLQEPLRKIQTFSDLLLQKSEAMGERDRDYLIRMQKAADRMQLLIRSLLSYSRVNSRAQPFVTVDLNQTMAEVLGDMESDLEATQAEVDVADLPTVEGDEVQLRQLFQNLLSNSLKFRARDDHPKVFVGIASETSDRVTIEFRDKGIGFDQQYAERIFSPFQRLHHGDQYRGSGIGLAIVKKILDRHDITAVVKSEINVGTSFRLTFLKQRALVH